MSDESEQHFDSTEPAYAAGVNKGKEQANAEANDAKEKQGKDELSYDALRQMSREELTARKDEIDSFLEAQGQDR